MKKIIFFQLWHGPGFENLSPESGSWYIKNYEAYFDEVHVIRLIGRGDDVVSDKTFFKTLGSGNNKIDFLIAPLRLYRYSKKIKADVFITYEQIWLWWIALFVKFFLRKKIYLIPVTIPSVMYKYTKRSLSVKLPIWSEKILTKLSYWFADYALTPLSYGSYVDWLKGEPILKKKLIVANKLPESIPAPSFFENIEVHKRQLLTTSNRNGCMFKLLYVGRLHSEKLVDHLVRMMKELKEYKDVFELVIVGDGPEEQALINLSKELHVDDRISFAGYVENADMARYYLNCNVFVSPLTGNSLREAALCATPIVAYKMDWITALLTDNENYLAVPPNNYKTMAAKVIELYGNKELAETLQRNIKEFAWEMWSPQNLNMCLSNVFSNIDKTT